MFNIFNRDLKRHKARLSKQEQTAKVIELLEDIDNQIKYNNRQAIKQCITHALVGAIGWATGHIPFIQKILISIANSI